MVTETRGRCVQSGLTVLQHCDAAGLASLLAAANGRLSPSEELRRRSRRFLLSAFSGDTACWVNVDDAAKGRHFVASKLYLYLVLYKLHKFECVCAMRSLACRDGGGGGGVTPR